MTPSNIAAVSVPGTSRTCSPYRCRVCIQITFGHRKQLLGDAARATAGNPEVRASMYARMERHPALRLVRS
jgi:hypothetical protein